MEKTIRSYYTNYYRDRLGLPDWEQKVESRIDEENVYPKKVLDWLENWLNLSFEGKRVLVVGAGTGAETFALQARGAEVAAIEPDSNAISILAAKARVKFRIKNPAAQAVGEALPFKDDYLDFVYCYSVLEHVQIPLKCIDEMIRVVRPFGWIFISTPDYRQIYEAHYKIMMPMFAPKWILRAWLRFKGRPVKFIDTLQFLTSRHLRNIFQNRPVTAFQVIHSWPSYWLGNLKIRDRLIKLMTQTFGIQRDQWWLIQKLEKSRE